MNKYKNVIKTINLDESGSPIVLKWRDRVETCEIFSINLPRNGDKWKYKHIKYPYDQATVMGNVLDFRLEIFKERKNYYVYVVRVILKAHPFRITKELERGYFDGQYNEDGLLQWVMIEEELIPKYYNEKKINKIVNELRSYTK